MRAATLGATLIGVNNRNLKTLTGRSGNLPASGPAGAADDATLVAESGLRTRADIERLQSAGYQAFLIGETLMRAGRSAGSPGLSCRAWRRADEPGRD